MIESAEVPLKQLPDGRKFLSDFDVVEQPHLLDFVSRFSNYWTRDLNRCGWVSPKTSDS